MNKMSDDEPPPAQVEKNPALSSPQAPESKAKAGPVAWLKDFVRGRGDNSSNLKEALDDYIEELKEANEDTDTASLESQKLFITNVIKTHDLSVEDIMAPRPDMVAIPQTASIEDLQDAFKKSHFSRMPVYAENLDHIVGILHIKDILLHLLDNKPVQLAEILREALFVSGSLPVMDLFLMMREGKRHMALVVDEHGGIDGLVTMNDVIEAIVGDIEDEFDHDEEPDIVEKPDGSLLADARMDIEDFEERYGRILTEEEREDIGTLGGLINHVAGRVPKRGEIFRHSSGMIMEVIESDKRRIHKARLRNIPPLAANDEV